MWAAMLDRPCIDDSLMSTIHRGTPTWRATPLISFQFAALASFGQNEFSDTRGIALDWIYPAAAVESPCSTVGRASFLDEQKVVAAQNEAKMVSYYLHLGMATAAISLFHLANFSHQEVVALN